MSEADEALEWVEYAEEDLILAKSALRRSKPLTIGSCFHSQQCAEKYFKAMLISHDVEFPKTHDLLILNTLCIDAGILTGFSKDDLDPIRKSGMRAHSPEDERAGKVNES